MSAVLETPLAAAAAVEQLAEKLLETAPHTPDHWNAWGSYRLGIVISAELAHEQDHSPVTEQELNTAYLSNLSETAKRVGATVMIPALDWGLEQWRKESLISYSALRPQSNTEWRSAGWADVLQGLAIGAINVRDERASKRHFVRRAAFRQLG